MPAYRDVAFPSTRRAALAHARGFAPHMGAEYARHRNEVVPGHPFVSRLAPAIRVRLLRESEVAAFALEEFGDFQACEKFLQEVYWRSYWRSWLELRPSVWTRYLETLQIARHSLDTTTRHRVEALECGESGIAPIDEFARELVATGYMHNHARMWFAAYWIHGERLPWELGADFFERHLLCACPASNTLSWRWVAGLQTQGKTYLARRSNLEKYCSDEYLGNRSGLDKLENPTAAPVPVEEIPPPLLPHSAPKASAPRGRLGLWITEDDLTPETSALGARNFHAACTSILSAPATSSTSNGKRREYRALAAQDAARRAKEHWRCPTHAIEAAHGDDLASRLIEWAKNHKIDTILALKPFVGTTGDALPQIEEKLNEAVIGLQFERRPEDVALLPYAKRGFFHFWEMCKTHHL